MEGQGMASSGKGRFKWDFGKEFLEKFWIPESFQGQVGITWNKGRISSPDPTKPRLSHFSQHSKPSQTSSSCDFSAPRRNSRNCCRCPNPFSSRGTSPTALLLNFNPAELRLPPRSSPGLTRKSRIWSRTPRENRHFPHINPG